MDMVVYANNQTMRMAGSYKLKDETKTKMEIISKGHRVEDTLLTNRLFRRVIDRVMTSEAKEETRPMKQISTDRINWNDTELREKLQKLLGEEHGLVIGRKGKGVVVCNNAGNKRLCVFGEVHTSNNFYLTLKESDDEIEVYYHCHGSECKGKSRQIGKLPKKELSVSEEVVYNEERVRGYNVGTRVLLTSAEMGRGMEAFVNSSLLSYR